MQTIADNESFETLVKENQDVVALVSATWCAPCKVIKPAFIAIETEVDQTMALIDLDDDHQIAATMRVRSVPTTVMFKGGVEVHRHTGVASEAKLLELIEKVYG